jgi:DNA-binding NarL/FixJ family response regulator
MKALTTFEAAIVRIPYPVLLTAREVMVMDYVVQGYDNHQIAAILENSPGTISHHVTHIRVKLRTHGRSRTRLVAAYLAERAYS